MDKVKFYGWVGAWSVLGAFLVDPPVVGLIAGSLMSWGAMYLIHLGLLWLALRFHDKSPKGD